MGGEEVWTFLCDTDDDDDDDDDDGFCETSIVVVKAAFVTNICDENGSNNSRIDMRYVIARFRRWLTFLPSLGLNRSLRFGAVLWWYDSNDVTNGLLYDTYWSSSSDRGIVDTTGNINFISGDDVVGVMEVPVAVDGGDDTE